MDGFNQYYGLPKKRITDLDGFNDITIPSSVEKEKNNLVAWNSAMDKGDTVRSFRRSKSTKETAERSGALDSTRKVTSS